jgi:hypothetical protein
LNEYPVGTTNATILRGTPSSIIRSIATGSAASDDVVVKAMMAGSFTARTKRRMGTRLSRATGSKATKAKTISAP